MNNANPVWIRSADHSSMNFRTIHRQNPWIYFEHWKTRWEYFATHKAVMFLTLFRLETSLKEKQTRVRPEKRRYLSLSGKTLKVNRINLGSGLWLVFEHDLFHDIDMNMDVFLAIFKPINCPVVWIPGIPLRKGLLETWVTPRIQNHWASKPSIYHKLKQTNVTELLLSYPKLLPPLDHLVVKMVIHCTINTAQVTILLSLTPFCCPPAGPPHFCCKTCLFLWLSCTKSANFQQGLCLEIWTNQCILDPSSLQEYQISTLKSLFLVVFWGSNFRPD